MLNFASKGYLRMVMMEQFTLYSARPLRKNKRNTKRKAKSSSKEVWLNLSIIRNGYRSILAGRCESRGVWV